MTKNEENLLFHGNFYPPSSAKDKPAYAELLLMNHYNTQGLDSSKRKVDAVRQHFTYFY
jgi:hypothetical protein